MPVAKEELSAGTYIGGMTIGGVHGFDCLRHCGYRYKSLV